MCKCWLFSVEILDALCGEGWCAENKEVNLLCFSQVFYSTYSLIDLLCVDGSPVTFYPLCRKPDPNSNVVVHTPSGVFGSRNLLQNQNGRIKGSRLVLTKKMKLPDSDIHPQTEKSHGSLSAARCRIYSRSNTKACIWGSHLIFGHLTFFSIFSCLTTSMKFGTNVSLLLLLFQKVDLEAIPHRLKGPSHHSLGAIENLNSFKASLSFRAPFVFIVSLCWRIFLMNISARS